MSGNTIPNGYTRIYFSDRKTGKKDAEYYDVPSNMTLAFGGKEYDLGKYGQKMTIQYSAGNADYTLKSSATMAKRINNSKLPEGYSVHQGIPSEIGDDWDAHVNSGEGFVTFTKGDHITGQKYTVSIFQK